MKIVATAVLAEDSLRQLFAYANLIVDEPIYVEDSVAEEMLRKCE